MEALPDIDPPLARTSAFQRGHAPGAAFGWLAAGWRDLWTRPAGSLAMGGFVLGLSWLVIAAMRAMDFGYILFPALSGFLVVAPLLAVGLYEKSRRLQAGEGVAFLSVLAPPSRGAGPLLFAGLLVCLLMLSWLRAANLLYALFFGLQPFPGLEEILPALLGTVDGWALIVTGTLVGGLFAAFTFAVTAISIPMLLAEPTDVLTAMGTSFATTVANLPAMLTWAAIVLAGFVLCVLTGLLGLVLIFPLLGHGTWHVYRAMRPVQEGA